ncbi:molybdopterin-dependent oxidoreductase [Glaciimonas sp. CA11.2]|uniref:molybdopterin-dependent oxidoreductase n=1 Tax=Glaciimonas sp. CA11.2 TaxID=3048601 RepID=UPI002AB35D3B|nr:molybdopterin-dependent oxidoreductase [Glaciimonas sp. CA11.2]MDY7546814.1 molybdopterin-dependent oxidoreductase [Glaciimonas sp. CA11.2]MEB0163975.1 molybdopterin-dependent oxidoreductase [Glaciimonas sp. CA11.2]
MKKRKFLLAALSATTIPAFAKKRTESIKETGPTLLTISGAIGKGNRGALDPALDQMMHKQNIQFDKAYVFNFATLTSLPAVDINPTLEYDAKPHALRGPLLTDVIAAAADKALPGNTAVKLRAVDGYVVQVALSDIRKYRFIVATHLDGQPIPLGGLGPLWAVYAPNSFPDMMARPLSARFPLCPWALYHIELSIA